MGLACGPRLELRPLESGCARDHDWILGCSLLLALLFLRKFGVRRAVARKAATVFFFLLQKHLFKYFPPQRKER